MLRMSSRPSSVTIRPCGRLDQQTVGFHVVQRLHFRGEVLFEVQAQQLRHALIVQAEVAHQAHDRGAAEPVLLGHDVAAVQRQFASLQRPVIGRQFLYGSANRILPPAKSKTCRTRKCPPRPGCCNPGNCAATSFAAARPPIRRLRARNDPCQYRRSLRKLASRSSISAAPAWSRAKAAISVLSIFWAGFIHGTWA